MGITLNNSQAGGISLGPQAVLRSGGGIGSYLTGNNSNGISVSDPFEDELKKRMQLAAQQGWNQDQINRSAMVERALHNQQTQAAQQATPDQPAASGPSGLKKFLVNAGALVGDTAAGIAGVAAAPVTGGASLAGAFGAGAGIEALRRKMLGENQSVGSDLVQGGLTALPGIGAARTLIRGGKAAQGAVDLSRAAGSVSATDRAAELVPTLASKKAAAAAPKTFDPHAALNDVLGKETLVPTQTNKVSQVVGNIADQFHPTNNGIFNKAGDRLVSGSRGVEAGAKVQGTSSKLLPHQANDINDFLDSIGAKGSAAKQLEKVQNVKQAAGEHIGNVIDRNNSTVPQEDLQSLMGKIKDNIAGPNGQGIAGFSESLHGPVANDFAKQLGGVQDLKGLQTFKQSLDDAVNYARKADSPDPIREQIATAFRGPVSEHIATNAPEVGTFNKIYSKATDASNALIQHANPKGYTGPAGILELNGKGLGGGTKQAVEGLAGRGLQNAGAILSTPAIKQFAKQYGINLLAGTEQGKFAANDMPQMPATTPTATGDPTNPGGLADPTSQDAQVINWALANGATDFDTISRTLQAADSGALSGTAGGAGTTASGSATDNGSPLGFSREDLINAAYQAVQNGDTAGLNQIKTLSGLLDSYDTSQLNSQKLAAGGDASTQKLSTADQARHDALQTALSSLDGAEQNLVTAGGAKGPLGFAATIPVLGQYLDPAGASYHSTKIELATQLAKAITGGSRPAQTVIEQYLHSLPDVNENKSFASSKIDKLRTELLTQAKSFGYQDLIDSNGSSGGSGFSSGSGFSPTFNVNDLLSSIGY